jgi:hypothetical protein
MKWQIFQSNNWDWTIGADEGDFHRHLSILSGFFFSYPQDHFLNNPSTKAEIWNHCRFYFSSSIQMQWFVGNNARRQTESIVPSRQMPRIKVNILTRFWKFWSIDYLPFFLLLTKSEPIVRMNIINSRGNISKRRIGSAHKVRDQRFECHNENPPSYLAYSVFWFP